MKSLEFIKQHVTEWPSNVQYGSIVTHVTLFGSGRVGFGSDTGGSVDVCYGYDLSEHFAPDYYDGKVYTREEFESFGVEKSGPNWNNAPDWAMCYGVIGSHDKEVWYDGTRYEYAHERGKTFFFDHDGTFSGYSVKHVADRPSVVKSVPTTIHVPNDGAKYEATIIGLCGTPVKIDIYRVLDAYPQNDPHIEHLIKKALKPGQRGHKDKRTDYLNIIESAQKALKLLDQKESLS